MWAAKEGHMDIVAWLRAWIDDHRVKDENLAVVKAEKEAASKALLSWKNKLTS